MRIHTPTPQPRESGDFPVIVNPGTGGKPFATIQLSVDWNTDIALDSLDDADRLIRAAVSAKRKMSAAIAGQRHEFAADDLAASWCAACGLIRGNAIHDAPGGAAVLAASIDAGTPVTVEDDSYCEAPDPDGRWHCALKPGHDGHHYSPRDMAELPAWWPATDGTNRPDDPDEARDPGYLEDAAALDGDEPGDPFPGYGAPASLRTVGGAA